MEYMNIGELLKNKITEYIKIKKSPPTSIYLGDDEFLQLMAIDDGTLYIYDPHKNKQTPKVWGVPVYRVFENSHIGVL